jgi:hypothetical protein
MGPICFSPVHAWNAEAIWALTSLANLGSNLRGEEIDLISGYFAESGLGITL